jgi:hypothetical protein
MEQMGGMEALIDKMPGMGQIPQSVKNQMMGAVESKKMVAMAKHQQKLWQCVLHLDRSLNQPQIRFQSD